MARYIDADELIEVLQGWREDSAMYDGSGNPVDSILYDVIRWIEDTPTADVAPRAEVAEELINMALSKIQIMISAIKAQEGNGIITEFNGGAKTALEIVFKDLAELKKKYTEEK